MPPLTLVCACEVRERAVRKITAREILFVIFFIVFGFWKCKPTDKYLGLRRLEKTVTLFRGKP
jgi:hypothetical protein